MSVQIGQEIGNRYFVEAFVGKGGMAEVFRVYDRQRAVRLAMKLLQADLAEDVVFLRRFRREAETLTTLQHPNIVRFYELEQYDDLVFMLMDFVDGTTLRKEIFRSSGVPFTPARVLEIMYPVCSALHYAHQKGVVHCDIKPANIMLDTAGRVLVADFGIARMTDAATVTMVGVGTPAYMAPEQAKGLDPSPQTDIYALGIVLYEMLTGGERPFTGSRATITGSTSEKVLWEKLNLTPEPPSHFNPALSPAIDAVIERCLSVQPARRYTGTLELLQDLERALGFSAEARADLANAPTVDPILSVESIDQSPATLYEHGRKPRPAATSQVAENQAPDQPARQPGARGKGLIWIAVGAVMVMAIVAAFFVSTSIRDQHVASTQTAVAQVQLTNDQITQEAIYAYQQTQAQTATAAAADRHATATAKAEEEANSPAAKLASSGNEKLAYIAQNWTPVVIDSFDDNANEWCLLDEYPRVSGSYDEVGESEVSQGSLQIHLKPVDGQMLFKCYPDLPIQVDFYTSFTVNVETEYDGLRLLVAHDLDEMDFSFGYVLQPIDGYSGIFDLFHYSSGNYAMRFYTLASSLPEYSDEKISIDSFDWPVKVGLLVENSRYTIFMNDQEVDSFNVPDSHPQYIGLRAYMDESPKDALIFTYDDFQLWTP